MPVRTYEVYTWDRLLIYFGACGLLPTVLATAAAAFNRWALPPRAWATFGLVLVAFWAGGVRLFQVRRAYQRTIDFYTPQGVAAVGVWQARDAGVATMLAGVVGEAIEHFALRHQEVAPGRHASTLAAEDHLRAYFNGVHLQVSTERLQRRGPDGRRQWARGLAAGQWVAVQWAPGEPVEVLMAIVRHELGHVACAALGCPAAAGKAAAPGQYAQEDHEHQLFTRIGWNW